MPAVPLYEFGWWKAMVGSKGGYDVTDGTIGPRQGAAIHSGKWLDSSPDWKTDSQPPHMRLVNIGQALMRAPDLEAAIKSEAFNELMGWINEFGLLGLLPHRLRAFHLFPIFTPVPPRPPQSKYQQISCTFASGRWVETAVPFNGNYPHKPTEGKVPIPVEEFERALASAANKAANTNSDSYDLFEGLAEQDPLFAPAGLRPEEAEISIAVGDPRVVQMPLGSAMRPYFPKPVRKETQMGFYPSPGVPAFWLDYREPVDELIQAVKLLAEAAHDLNHGDPSKINQLFSRSEVFLAGSGPPYQLAWRHPSQLCSLAHRIALDAAAGLLKACEECNRLFVEATGKPGRTKQYCGKSCQTAASQKKTRDGQREAKRLSKAGVPPEEIARAVGRSTEQVMAWITPKDAGK